MGEEDEEEEKQGTQEHIQIEDDDEELLFASDDAGGEGDEEVAGAPDMATVIQRLKGMKEEIGGMKQHINGMEPRMEDRLDCRSADAGSMQPHLAPKGHTTQPCLVG